MKITNNTKTLTLCTQSDKSL